MGFRSISPLSLASLTFLFSFSKYQRTHTERQETKIEQLTFSQVTPNPFHLPRTAPGLGGVGVTNLPLSSVFAFLTATHPDVPVLMIGFPISPSVTVQHTVLGHPVWAAVSSLGCNGTDLLPISKVNLKPLIMVTVRRRPSPSTWRRWKQKRKMDLELKFYNWRWIILHLLIGLSRYILLCRYTGLLQIHYGCPL